MDINITTHAYERYAFRIKSANDKLEVNALLGKYKEKYKEEILKLYSSADLYYTGMIGSTGKNPICLFINNGGWVLLTDIKQQNLITLYKPDLGVDDEDFNKEYIAKMIAKLKKLKEETEKIDVESCEKRKASLAEIDRMEEKIGELNTLVADYKKQIESIRLGLNSLDVDTKESKRIYKEALENFCIRRMS